MENDAPQTEAEGFAVIQRRYLHLTAIPFFIDDDATVWLDRAWHRDLVEHFTYLKDFVSCAPRLPRGSEPDLVRFEVPQDVRISFIQLPPQTSFLSALLRLPVTAAVLWRAVGKADIVHTGIGGWPYPLGWIAAPFALLRGKRLLINVESDWRLTAPGRDRWKHRVMNMDPIRNGMARWACAHAHLALFTHSSYRDSLCRRNPEIAHVSPAVWVNDGDILDEAAAEASWEAKSREPVRLLFAGRLVVTKGIGVLLDALRSLDARGVDVRVDIIGQGEERDACLRAAADCRSVRISVLEPVPYGRPFFELARRYHALLVPSLTQEQPRVIFDAYAQGVPVIASETDGHRPYVEHNRTGWLVPVGDAPALAAAIQRSTTAAAELRTMGLAALHASRGLTHQAMHRWRSRLIRDYCT